MRPADDHYPTPPEVTRALLSVERFGGPVWEPCAGSGEMAATLRRAGYTVAATTIGEGRGGARVGKYEVEGGCDVLACTHARHPSIATNPPYRDVDAILAHLLTLDVAKVALFLNVKFLAGQKRAATLHREAPPARVWVFADRVSLYPAGWDGPRNSTTETMAWFVWDFPSRGAPPQVGWLRARDFADTEQQGQGETA